MHIKKQLYFMCQLQRQIEKIYRIGDQLNGYNDSNANTSYNLNESKKKIYAVICTNIREFFTRYDES